MTMIIAVDCRPLTAKKSGIGRYVEEILDRLVQLRSTDTFILISNREIISNACNHSNVRVVTDDVLTVVPGTIWLRYFAARLLNAMRIDIFWSTMGTVSRVGDVPTILTVYDLVAYDVPQTMTCYNRLVNRIWLPRGVREATVVTSISEFTRQRVARVLSFEIPVKHVVRCAVDTSFFFPNDIMTTDDDKRYILTVGTLEPRKNLIELIDVFAYLKQYGKYDGRLVIVGEKGWKARHYNKNLNVLRQHSAVEFVGYVSDVSLREYYRNCDCFVYPSIYEGFGIPPLEAYCCGSKVLCSSNTEMPNLDLPGMRFFRPRAGELTAALESVLEEGNNLARHQNLRGETFDVPSWSASAERFSELITIVAQDKGVDV